VRNLSFLGCEPKRDSSFCSECHAEEPVRELENLCGSWL
jgi:hypothetical protein